MYAKSLVTILGGLAIVNAQAPPPQTLTSTMSGVDPIATSPISLEIIEGAIVYDGPPVEGFTGPGGNATIQTNNPAATYRAVLPSTNFDNTTGSIIIGTITGVAGSNGTGVLFTVDFSGFPSDASYGPFVYHVHGMPVPADGNCTATLGHLDPTNRGELHACEVAAPQTCQAGDLAGKHGNITTTSLTAQYLELYLSTNPTSPYFFGSKSIVVHSSNTTRLTCANFALVNASNATTNNASSTIAPISPTEINAAGSISNFVFSIALGGVAAILIPFLL